MSGTEVNPTGNKGLVADDQVTPMPSEVVQFCRLLAKVLRRLQRL